jgi:light-regulated signal transduction histidine kinase (bacteriophytochrome)
VVGSEIAVPVEINDILHVLAHELRTPVGIAHGYIRLLLEDRLADGPERRRALEQMQKALSRLTELSHETTALASHYEQELNSPQPLSAHDLAKQLSSAEYDCVVNVEMTNLPDVTLRTSDPAALVRALVAIVRATARELRGDACSVSIRGDSRTVELLAGPSEHMMALAAGPESADSGPLILERGGLGLSLVHAAVVLDAHGARRWALKASRQTAGIRFPLQELHS